MHSFLDLAQERSKDRTCSKELQLPEAHAARARCTNKGSYFHLLLAVKQSNLATCHPGKLSTFWWKLGWSSTTSCYEVACETIYGEIDILSLLDRHQEKGISDSRMHRWNITCRHVPWLRMTSPSAISEELPVRGWDSRLIAACAEQCRIE